MKLLAFVTFTSCILYLNAVAIDNSKSSILPTKQYCGYQHSDDVAEENSVHEFPWLVFIPLKSRVFNPDANIRCAGTLISKRYVVMSKTCLQFVLTKVHLGVHNTKDTTCDSNQPDCLEPLEVGIEERVIDEEKDIVLLRLDQDVAYTDTIRPICLPFDDFKKPEPGATVFSSGWGLTSAQGPVSDTKKIVKETLISNEDCHKSGLIKDPSDEKIICVKMQDDSVTPPCNGDEGSPIMYSDKQQWILTGVLSMLFDSHDLPCSIKDPARGVRITDDLLQWIVEKVHA